MPDGDDVLEVVIPIEGKGDKKVADLPEGVLTSLLNESVQAHQAVMHEAKNNAASANNLVRHIAAKKFDQVDTIEASSVEKVLTAGK